MTTDPNNIQLDAEFEGKQYVFNGTSWRGKTDFMNPPSGIAYKLNGLIADQLKEIYGSVSEIRTLNAAASKFREMPGLVEFALHLSQRAYQKSPKDAATASVLSSILRKINRPEEALAVTDELASVPYSPLLTTRAAALCDLEKWEEAHKCIQRALATVKAGQKGEAMSVWQRINAAAPELTSRARRKRDRLG